ncbi:hypothetical protein OsI_35364 [Oryza sativa Indica Group]|uniref:Uncharacterized protein n=1 Tax=Oryza sativa subsp. indica TaxID=39946 RepID=B8BJG5_ORYSI|nr:hypothetical protein OsI_35364 [Oryza sativa Indica Group]
MRLGGFPEGDRRQDDEATAKGRGMTRGGVAPCLPETARRFSRSLARCGVGVARVWRGAALARCAVHGKAARCSTRLGTTRRPGRHFVERLACTYVAGTRKKKVSSVGLGLGWRRKKAVGRPA